MSVINHVLQQLEQRRAAPAGQTSGAPLSAVPAKRPRRLGVIVALGVGAISMAAFGDWPQLFKSPAKSPAQAVAAAASVPEAAVVATMAGTPLPAAPIDASMLAATAPPAPRASAAPPAAPMMAAPLAAPMAAPTAAPTAVPLAPLAAEPMLPAVPVGARPRSGAAPASAATTTLAAHTLPSPRPLAPPLPSISKTATPETTPARAQTLWRQAQESAQAGHRQLAIERASEALQHEPTLHAARYLAAALMAESGRAVEAETLLRDGPGTHSPAAAALLARLLAERGDTDGALQLLDQHQLRDADAQGLRGVLYARQGYPARARVAYEAALAQRPQQPTWWLGLAIAFEAEQMAPQARQAFERATLLGLAEPELALYAETRLRALAR